MIAYEWVSITAANRYMGAHYGNMAPGANIWRSMIQLNSWTSYYAFLWDDQWLRINMDDIVGSVVADFRDAVAAGFYDVAKDEPTWVPISCVQHIDSIVFYNFCLRIHLHWDVGGTVVWNFVAEGFKSEWKRAVIYRRELGVFTRKMIAGDMFPENIAEVSISGTPSYIGFKSRDRSL